MRKCALCAAVLFVVGVAQAQIDDRTKQLAHDIFKQLIEINTTDSVGSGTAASEAMAQRFRDAGFPESDLRILAPNDRKKNLVVRLHGSGKHKPVLLIGHLDVVEARREMLRGSATLAGSVFLAHLFPAKLLRASAAGYRQPAPSPAALLASMRAKFNAVPMETQKLADNVTMLSGPGGSVVVLNGPRANSSWTLSLRPPGPSSKMLSMVLATLR